MFVMAKDFYAGEIVQAGRSFSDKECRCRQVFQMAVEQFGGFWHLCTPGEGQPVIFRKREDYAFMMTLIACCAYAFPAVKVITFEVMSNHVHLLLCGSREDVLAFFALLRRRLKRYLALAGDAVGLPGFDCRSPVPAESLESVRNQIVYINRNNFLVDPDQTPFSYPYGGNSYYYNPVMKRFSDGRFGDLSQLAKRALLRSRETDYPDDWLLADGYLSPLNYLRLDIGEGLFRDARHYFHKISREIESYKEVAAQLGESLYYTDDELGAILFRISKQTYDGLSPNLLPQDKKMELARKLHYDYNADNGRIARLLKMPRPLLDQVFRP